jgi:hypothetical protein
MTKRRERQAHVETNETHGRKPIRRFMVHLVTKIDFEDDEIEVNITAPAVLRAIGQMPEAQRETVCSSTARGTLLGK